MKLLTALTAEDKLGSKADCLGQLIAAGFTVPNGFVIASGEKVDRQQLAIYIEKIGGFPVAVRSSSKLEDMENASFAGLYSTYLNVSETEDVILKIEECFKSAQTHRVKDYLEKKGMLGDSDVLSQSISVLVQKQISSKFAGVLFNINPVSGIEEHSLIELCHGLGEKLVSGLVSPSRYIYNTEAKKVNSYEPGGESVDISGSSLDNLILVGSQIQEFYGTPQDIEFSFDNNGKLWILQSRPITKIKWRTDMDEFSNADFKDGGVSAKICTPMMYSLYRASVNMSMEYYFDAVNLVSKNKKQQWITYKYGIPYWNAGVIKRALTKIPGFDERKFDVDIGVQKSYGKEGPIKTKMTPFSIMRAIPVLLGLQKEFSQCEKMIDKFDREFNKKDSTWKNKISELDEMTTADLLHITNEMINSYYLETESSYFRTIYNNSNYQTLYKEFIEKLERKLGDLNYLKLMSDLAEVSHMEVQKDISTLFQVYKSKTKDSKEFKAELENFLKKHYHHGDAELDILVPRWGEDASSLFKLLDFYTEQGESPRIDNKTKYFEQEFKHIQDKIRAQSIVFQLINKKQFVEKTTRMRTFLLNRERMREYSTRSYFVVRKFLLALGDRFVQEQKISKRDDIFFCKIEDLQELESSGNIKNFQNLVITNKEKYQQLRLFTPPNEFGAGVETKSPDFKKNGKGILTGVPCSSGTVTGKARVIFSPQEIDTIETGEILVTKFTDPGWTPVLGVVAGVVTEVGGILSHAAVIGREYGIPVVLNIPHVSQTIKTGARITVNGDTGEVEIHRENK